MIRRLVLAIGILVLAAPAGASEIRRGSIELIGDIAFQHNSLSGDYGGFTRIDARTDALRAVSDVFQVGVGMIFSFVSSDLYGGNTASGGLLGAEGVLRANFGDSEVVIPYLQAAIGLGSWYGDFNEDSVAAVSPSATFGLRYPFRDAVALNLEFTYVRELHFQGIEDIDANTFLVGIGFSFFPRGLGGHR